MARDELTYEAAIRELATRAQEKADRGDGRLLQVMQNALMQKEHGNPAIMDQLIEISTMKKKRQELGFFGKTWAALSGGVKQGVIGIAMGGIGMGGVTYAMGRMGMGGIVASEQELYTQNKNLAVSLSNATKTDSKIDLLAAVQSNPRFEPNKFNPDLDDKAINKMKSEEQKVYLATRAEYRKALNSKVEEYEANHGKVFDRPDLQTVALQRATNGAALSGLFGGLTGFLGSWNAAAQARKEEILVWELIHDPLPAPLTAAAPPRNVAELPIKPPNVPLRAAGITNQQPAIT